MWVPAVNPEGGQGRAARIRCVRSAIEQVSSDFLNKPVYQSIADTIVQSIRVPAWSSSMPRPTELDRGNR
jgi:hypothetical protein